MTLRRQSLESLRHKYLLRRQTLAKLRHNQTALRQEYPDRRLSLQIRESQFIEKMMKRTNVVQIENRRRFL